MVNGALANYGNKVDLQKSSVIAFNGTNPNSDINYEIGSVIPFINNLGGDIPASAWYEGKYGECNGQNIGGLQNVKGVIKAGSIFYAQLVKNDLIYYFDVVTDKIVNQLATKSDVTNYGLIQYNSNTDLSNLENRKNAILYCLNSMPDVRKAVIRYFGGYYLMYEFYHFDYSIFVLEVGAEFKTLNTWVKFPESDLQIKVNYI